MDDVAGAGTFRRSGDAYDDFMGRYSRPLALVFADFLGVGSDATGLSAVDVGCGPGALTAVLVERLGAENVVAIDPSEQFVEACRVAHDGVDVTVGRAERIPHADSSFDVAAAQLVMHFVSEPLVAAREMRRVLRPGGVAGACVWEFGGGMSMLRHFWDAALSVDSGAPDEAAMMSFGRAGEIAELFERTGLEHVSEAVLEVEARYRDFDELWTSFLHGVGPAGAYLVSLDDRTRDAVRTALRERIGSPAGSFGLRASARAAIGHAPG